MGKKSLNFLDRWKNNIEVDTLDSQGRDSNLRRQILSSFALKIISVLLSLILVPFLLGILGDEKYGVWIILLSFASWILLFDIGIGNGLRNKLTYALAKAQIKEAQEYISTAYILLGGIVLVLFAALFGTIPFINYQYVFNTSKISSTELQLAFILVGITILLNFLLGLVNQLFNAKQSNQKTVLIPIGTNSLFLLSLLLFQPLIKENLAFVAICYAGSAILTSSIISFFFFYKNRELYPRVSFFNKIKVRDILGLGGQFFFIQLSTVVIFATDNILIAQLLSPEEVTPYAIVRQLFGTLNMIAALIMAPLWSAFTEAFAKKDYYWIRRRIKLLNILMIPLALTTTIIYFLSGNIIHLWIGDTLNISETLKILMALFIMVSVWNNIYSFFLNGISRTKEQIITAIIGLLINIPISIFFAKNCELGSAGIILGTIVSLSFFAIIGPYTTYKILNKVKNE